MKIRLSYRHLYINSILWLQCDTLCAMWCQWNIQRCNLDFFPENFLGYLNHNLIHFYGLEQFSVKIANNLPVDKHISWELFFSQTQSFSRQQNWKKKSDELSLWHLKYIFHSNRKKESEASVHFIVSKLWRLLFKFR